jgi:hypothetical protein
VYTLAPSNIDLNLVWAGTDDGLIHVTRNGGTTWTDVTPPALVPWAKVSVIEASHFDPNSAYAAVNTLRLDDLRPHIYRTRDAGRSWVEIVSGLPAGGVINVVREDPLRRGLLFAGSEQGVFVSFDDGDVWRPLRLNMPATSVRDLVIKDAISCRRMARILDPGRHQRRQITRTSCARRRLFAPPTRTSVERPERHCPGRTGCAESAGWRRHQLSPRRGRQGAGGDRDHR